MRFLLLLIAALPLLGGTVLLDGAKVAYSAVGQGRTAVVLIHGWTCDRTFWDDQVRALQGNYRVIALDLPGHGASGPAPDYSMKRFARAVEAVLREEKIAQAVLASHSMGGAVMLEFARLCPEKVLGIIAVDAFFPGAEAAKGLAALAARFDGPGARQAREEMMRSMFTAATGPEVQRKILDVMLGAPAETAAGAMRGLADPAVWRQDSIAVPFIEITTAGNTMFTLEAVRTRFPRAELVRVPGAGHFLHMEKPAEVNRIMLAWLKAQGL